MPLFIMHKRNNNSSKVHTHTYTHSKITKQHRNNRNNEYPNEQQPKPTAEMKVEGKPIKYSL